MMLASLTMSFARELGRLVSIVIYLRDRRRHPREWDVDQRIFFREALFCRSRSLEMMIFGMLTVINIFNVFYYFFSALPSTALSLNEISLNVVLYINTICTLVFLGTVVCTVVASAILSIVLFTDPIPPPAPTEPEPTRYTVHGSLYKYNPDDATVHDCCICLQDFAPEHQLLRLPCNHEAHDTCLTEWMRTKGRCPMCRKGPASQS